MGKLRAGDAPEPSLGTLMAPFLERAEAVV